MRDWVGCDLFELNRIFSFLASREKKYKIPKVDIKIQSEHICFPNMVLIKIKNCCSQSVGQLTPSTTIPVTTHMHAHTHIQYTKYYMYMCVVHTYVCTTHVHKRHMHAHTHTLKGRHTHPFGNGHPAHMSLWPSSVTRLVFLPLLVLSVDDDFIQLPYARQVPKT